MNDLIEPPGQPKPPGDPLERRLRIGCGSLIGLALALMTSAYLWRSWTGFLVTALLAAAVCSWLALRHGDRFFEEALQCFGWPWW